MTFAIGAIKRGRKSVRAWSFSFICLISWSLRSEAFRETDYWITSKDYGNLRVVQSDEASPSEKYAASEFKDYWKQATGQEVSSGTGPLEGVNVWIGRRGVPEALLDKGDLEDLGDDGLIVRTLKRGDSRKIRANHLILAGGQKRGSLYAVYQFFEDGMGIRWLAPETTYIPPEPPGGVPRLDITHIPPLVYRDTNYRAFVQNPHFALVHKLNGNFAPIPEEWGGHISYARNGFGHTFHSFVAPEEYGKDHPEYFSEVEGKRRTAPNGTQLDLTNPDVLEITKNKVADLLASGATNEKIVSITQMDWDNWNESWPMAAIDELEGSRSGSLIRFVNQVAESIEDRFPDAFIDTFAYTFTRKPPKLAKPRDNVIVRLCSIECDFGRSIGDTGSNLNRDFRKDLLKWSKITKNLYVWDYTQNWHAFQGPHPNLHVLQPNIQFYVANGVKGIFEQASPSSPHSDFEYLKGYILAHALWNPEVDWRRLYAEFLTLYYKEAAPFIDEYINLITRKVQNDNFPLTIFSHMDWMDYDTVAAAEEIFQRAFATVQDPVIRERLADAHIPVQYSALVCPPRIKVTTDAYVFDRPPSQSFDEYWDMLMKNGVTHLEDNPIEEFRVRLNGQTPPRHEEVPLVRLENENYALWITPTLGGAIQRWEDKRLGMELFTGYENPVKGHLAWQEWTIMDPENPEIEGPIASSYSLVSRATNHVTLSAALANGLVVTRTMTLEPSSSRLDVVLELRNCGSSPIVPRVKIHPEFWTQETSRPQVWLDSQKEWIDEPTKPKIGERALWGKIDPAGHHRWALRIPSKGLVLINTFDPGELSTLAFFHSTAEEQLNLELFPDLSPLASGGVRRIHTSYEILDQLPDLEEKPSNISRISAILDRRPRRDEDKTGLPRSSHRSKVRQRLIKSIPISEEAR
jgi:hypothetical protein